jgi:glycosyltransferase involved in cell wall biosynthesis
MERNVLKAADRVVVTHRRVKEELLRHYSAITYHDVVILSQGFDPEDFAIPAQKKKPSMKMRIAHAGTFYGNRTPDVLFRALANLIRANPKLRGRIEVNLIGVAREEEKLLAQKYDLQDVVNFCGYMPHRECVQMLMESDLLWFVVDNDYQTPGKLYEYFGTRKPILASVVEGYTKQLILESGGARCIPLKDVAMHEQAILELFHKYEVKKLPALSADFVDRFDRKMVTAELAKIFEFLMEYDKGTFVKMKEDAQ